MGVPLADDPRPNRLVVFCDGTWCGRETNTTSNVEILANLMGVQTDRAAPRGHDVPYALDAPDRGLRAAYFEGVGLGKSFLEYIYDGAIATTIAEECTSAYKFIVENYDPSYEIWMFGLSRGAYTVRSVAGMINNCGIIRARSDPAQTKELCDDVYKIYRSPYDIDKPDSVQSKAFKANEEAVWQVKTPIKFLGLFDTVGSLGIPRINAGMPGSFDYPEFNDQNVSSEVEKVYHAVSLHDRLWAFEPCLATRDPKAQKANPNLEIVEKWFPGCHYDLGRQRFRFFRESSNIVERTLSAVPNKLSETVHPNEVLSDNVLRWMLESIRHVDPSNKMIPDIDTRILKLMDRIESGQLPTGSGDVYGDLLPFFPFGSLWTTISVLSDRTMSLLDKVTPNVRLGNALSGALGIRTVLRIILATRDRRISNRAANVDIFTDPLGVSGKSVATLGDVKARYPSRTYQSYWLWKLVLGSISQERYNTIDSQEFKSVISVL